MVRTAGQVIENGVLGSIEYAVEEFKTPIIMVLGHDSCGAVTAARTQPRQVICRRGLFATWWSVFCRR